jgi:hypothetical protein
MFTLKLDRLPEVPVSKILILRTAPTDQVVRAIDGLRQAYPEAGFGVLGTNLDANSAFDGMEHFEVRAAWLSPKTFRPLRDRVKSEGYDLVVMCLNSDCGAGYAKASRVMRLIDADAKLIAGYNGHWCFWEHSNFEEGAAPIRWLVSALGVLTYPFSIAVLLLTSSRPRYMPAGQGRPAPRYES